MNVRVADTDSVLHVTLQYRPRGLSPEEVARRRDLLAELAAQRRKWDAARPARYRLRVDVECFCFGGPPPAFEVVGDSVVAIHGASGPRNGVPESWTMHTVERLFAALEAEIRDENRDVTNISYHGRYRFPTRYDSDTRLGITDSWAKVRVEFSEVRRR